MRRYLILAFANIVGNFSQPALTTPSSLNEEIQPSRLSPLESLSQIPNRLSPKPFLPPPDLPSETESPPLETPSPQPVPSPSVEIPGTIDIERFEFVGNTAFSDEELREIVRDFTGREITFSELLEAEAAVRQKYQAGCGSNNTDQPCYINSDAIIPAGQKIEGGVVTIQIIEGSLEDIEIRGTRRLKPDYIRSRLALAAEPPLELNRLLEALQLLQLDPLIETISAELSRGIRPESNLLRVQVTEADSFTFTALANNGRNPSVGSFQRGFSLKEGNLLGWGDAVGVDYFNTDGSNAVYANYTLPLNSRNGTIKLAGGFNSNAVIDRLFEQLDITGQYYFYELTYRQPLFQSPSEEFALGLTASRQESQNFLLGEGFSLSPGADETGQIRISAIRFFQDWLKRNPQEVFALRSQFSLGIEALDGTSNLGELPDSSFFTWRTQGQYVRQLAPETLLVVRSDLQVASEPLFAIEQFSLGGLYTVRGYPQDFLLTDSAFFASVEARLPILRVPEAQGILQIVPFLDLGIGWNAGDFPNPNPNTLVGTGLGLLWQMGDNFSARFDWGIPLVPIPSALERNSWNANGLYFSINWNLF